MGKTWTAGLILAAALATAALHPALAQEGGTPEERVRALGIVLPAVPKPVANYVPSVRVGNLLFLAGAGPFQLDGSLPAGKVGREFTIEQGARYARDTCIVQLAVMRAAVGSLDRIKRIVRVTGMVNATPEFREHPKVINGCSDLFVAVFGEAGKHARAAVGMASLPFDIPVEIEVTAEIAE